MPTAVDLDETPGAGVTFVETEADEIAQFSSSMQPSFITAMQKDLSAGEVCRSTDIPVTAMRTFAKALYPEFVWEDLEKNFKETILGLLIDRSNRVKSRPSRKLFELERDVMQTEDAWEQSPELSQIDIGTS